MKKQILLMVMIVLFSITFISAREVTCSDNGIISLYKGNVNGSFDDECGSNNATSIGVIFTNDGKYDGAYFSPSGSNSFNISIPYDESLDFGVDDFTISLWTKLNDDTAGSIVHHFDDSNFYGWGVFVESGSYPSTFLIYFVDNTESDEITLDGNFPVETDVWYHLAITREDSNYTFYVDGSVVDSVNNSDVGNLSANFDVRLFIGIVGTYNGTTDELAFFDSALTPVEVLELYEEEVIEEEEDTGLIQGSGTTYNILASSGAGLGKFFEYLTLGLPVLIIGLSLVGIIVAIGFAIASVFNKFRINPKE